LSFTAYIRGVIPVTCGHTNNINNCGNDTDSAGHADSVKIKNGKKHANIMVTRETHTKFCQQRDIAVRERGLYEGNSICKLQIQVATYVF
jgi:hypothetical protein